jgi:hypothetical protein
VTEQVQALSKGQKRRLRAAKLKNDTEGVRQNKESGIPTEDSKLPPSQQCPSPSPSPSRLYGTSTREQRAALASDTITILGKMKYLDRKGQVVDLKSSIDYAVANSVLYLPKDDRLGQLRSAETNGAVPATVFEVTRETTLQACHRLVCKRREHPTKELKQAGVDSKMDDSTATKNKNNQPTAARDHRSQNGQVESTVVALNFASARNPGKPFSLFSHSPVVVSLILSFSFSFSLSLSSRRWRVSERGTGTGGIIGACIGSVRVPIAAQLQANVH